MSEISNSQKIATKTSNKFKKMTSILKEMQASLKNLKITIIQPRNQ